MATRSLVLTDAQFQSWAHSDLAEMDSKRYHRWHIELSLLEQMGKRRKLVRRHLGVKEAIIGLDEQRKQYFFMWKDVYRQFTFSKGTVIRYGAVGDPLACFFLPEVTYSSVETLLMHYRWKPEVNDTHPNHVTYTVHVADPLSCGRVQFHMFQVYREKLEKWTLFSESGAGTYRFMTKFEQGRLPGIKYPPTLPKGEDVDWITDCDGRAETITLQEYCESVFWREQRREIVKKKRKKNNNSEKKKQTICHK